MNEPEASVDLLFDALREYQEMLRAGSRPPMDEFLTRYPHLGPELRDMLLTAAVLEDSGSRDAVPARLGEYRLLREVGRGGMGVVYEAVQESLGRHVAVKILSRRDGTLVERFQREARIAARLHHTNIVPVFAVGAEGGVPFYVMQFIAGSGLNQWIASRQRGSTLVAAESTAEVGDGTTSRASVGEPLPAIDFNTVAALGVQAAEALAYAHGQSVLHRDLKPANFLLDADGTLWIADFGLAKAADDGDLTGSGAMLGTLRYMAPERLTGQCDARSDIYSLGATLYELLTLRPAFDAADHPALVEQVARGTPPAPRSIDSSIPRDLETVVMKAMAREPAARYATAADFATDLRRFRDGQPVSARPPGPVERLTRWTRRNPAWAALYGVSFAALVTVAVYSVKLRTALADSNANLAAAQTQNERADGNLAVLRKAIDSYTDLLEKEPKLNATDLSDVKKKLLASAVSFYEVVAGQQTNEPDACLARLDAMVKLGKLRQFSGDRVAALADFERLLALAAEFASRFPDDSRFPPKVGEALHSRANLIVSMSRVDDAVADYDRAIATQRGVLAKDPKNTSARGLLVQHLVALANLRQTHQPKIDPAPLLEEALPLSAAHVADAPDNPIRLRGRALVLTHFAAVCENGKRYDEAEASHRQAIAAYEQAVRLDPATLDYVNQLHSIEQMFGGYLARRGRYAEGDEWLTKATVGSLELMERHPSMFTYRQDALVNCIALGRSLWMQKKGKESLVWFDRAVTLLPAVPESGPDRNGVRNQRSTVFHCRAMVHEQVKQYAEAARDWAQAALHANDATQSRPQWFASAKAVARDGRHDDALRKVEELLKLPTTSPGEMITAARVHAIVAAAEKDLTDEHAIRAIELIRKAIALGYKDLAGLASEEDFAVLRSRPDYRAALEQN